MTRRLLFVPLLLLQDVKKRARQDGFLRTMSGRRRLLPNITNKDYEKRGRAERVAINGTVQGSAADLVKGAMVQLLSDLREQGLSQHCRMMVQVGRCVRGWEGRLCGGGRGPEGESRVLSSGDNTLYKPAKLSALYGTPPVTNALI